VIAWEAAFRVFDWGWKFPSALQTAQAFYDGVTTGKLLGAIAASLGRILLSFFLAVVLGTSLGFLFARFRWVDDTFGFLVVALQTVPSIAWLPFAIIWFGLNDVAVVFITTIGATWTMTLAARTGVLNLPTLYSRAGRMLGTGTGLGLFLQVVLPGSFPHLMTGVRVAWAFAWRALTAGELLSRGLGLGQTLQDSRDIGDTAMILCVVLVIAVIGTIMDNVFFQSLENRILVRYGLSTDRKRSLT